MDQLIPLLKLALFRVRAKVRTWSSKSYKACKHVLALVSSASDLVCARCFSNLPDLLNTKRQGHLPIVTQPLSNGWDSNSGHWALEPAVSLDTNSLISSALYPAKEVLSVLLARTWRSSEGTAHAQGDLADAGGKGH